MQVAALRYLSLSTIEGLFLREIGAMAVSIRRYFQVTAKVPYVGTWWGDENIQD